MMELMHSMAQERKDTKLTMDLLWKMLQQQQSDLTTQQTQMEEWSRADYGGDLGQMQNDEIPKSSGLEATTSSIPRTSGVPASMSGFVFPQLSVPPNALPGLPSAPTSFNITIKPREPPFYHGKPDEDIDVWFD